MIFNAMKGEGEGEERNVENNHDDDDIRNIIESFNWPVLLSLSSNISLLISFPHFMRICKSLFNIPFNSMISYCSHYSVLPVFFLSTHNDFWTLEFSGYWINFSIFDSKKQTVYIVHFQCHRNKLWQVDKVYTRLVLYIFCVWKSNRI